MLYTGVAFIFVLLLLTVFTYAYHLALAISVIGMVLLGLLLPKQNSQRTLVSMFELNNQGRCTFDDDVHYQLQASSRFSFLGCWLVLQPVSTISAMYSLKNKNLKNKSLKNKNAKKLFFIYRDSLSQQDFSRLSNVITQLDHQC